MEMIKKRNGSIDFWRFIFCCVVVTFHTFLFFGNYNPSPFIGGSVAVEFFFLVSGFLMAQSSERILANYTTLTKTEIGQHTRVFIFRKIKGLFPELLVAWVIGFVVEHLVEKNITIVTVIKDLLTGMWELFFLRMSGLVEFRANTVTWYISAMILVMLFWFPLLIYYRDLFFYVIAPIVCCFILGFMCKEYGKLGGAGEWNGFMYKGLMRAVAEIPLGCILWKICQKIKQYKYTVLTKIFFSVVEILGYLFALLWMWGHKGSYMDFVLLMLLSISVTISFSHIGILSNLFDNKFCYRLGYLSLPLYIGHIYWVHTLKSLFPGYSFRNLMLIYLVVLVFTVFLIIFLSNQIRIFFPIVKTKVRKYFVLDNE